MTARLLFLSALALALMASPARACPCSDDAGSGGGLVREDERYAASLVATSRHALGRFDAFGRYSALAATERETSEELLLRVGLRLPQRIEWLGELGYAAYRFHAPGLVETRSGVGDALLHLRVRLRNESMPHDSQWFPGLTARALLRIPLGGIAEQRAGSFGSGGAQLGLGAWEAGLGGEAVWSMLPKLQLLLGTEAAYRFEDHVLGAARRLGPRVDLAVGARAPLSAWFSTSALVRARWTSDVTLAERRLPGTAERLWSVVVGAALYDHATRLRSSVTLSLDPPWSSLSAGSTAAAALSVALGYGAE